MDTDGFPLAAISEKSNETSDGTPKRSKTKTKRQTSTPTSENSVNLENGDAASTNSRKRNKTKTSLENIVLSEPSTIEPIPETNHTEVEINEVTDDDEGEPERERRLENHVRISDNLTEPMTMISSYTTGGENDVIEIHQFSVADLDVYLEIYFETLSNRLRHYIGGNDQLNQFRASMKNRIATNTTSREYQNVLLGKMNGEVVAAVTMLFPNETPTVPLNYDRPQQGSCLQSLPRWIIRKANYVPTNMDECYIEMIGVKSAFRNRGIGAAMLECVEHYARQVSAALLTIHIHGPELQLYFERYGFNIDRSDSSGFWKWIVERQNVTKLSKIVSPDDGENLEDSMGSYLNESMAESLDQ